MHWNAPGSDKKNSRMSLIELVTRLGWRYRAEDVLGSLISMILVNNK